ncbi:isopenicillin N synthase family oxygenase [Simkania negevensis]|uniref:2-oxoglutarate-dependent ethylene/succinate-forming enzyme n=1 Tax=Simkania negevensis TaxID=83561 RepID=A0ABS3AQ55_9BACT|nr:isopenicillin N synthase family oxygenase [Simkania negevensis]
MRFFSKVNCLKISCLFTLFVVSSLYANPGVFDSTIPVVDMRDFDNPQTREKFVQQVSDALHEVGFFAVVNPGVDIRALENGYAASKHFFSQSVEKKKMINDPATSGERGYTQSEIAQGQSQKDYKEFIHIGRNRNLWPDWMDLQHPMEELIKNINHHGRKLQQAFALAIGEREDFFTSATEEGESLLRALFYPKNPAPGQFWSAVHTDIGLFTILPMATEEGLQVFHRGEWIDVRIPPEAFIINGGDQLENITNGYFKSAKHRVVSKPDVERYSMVYFVHGGADHDVSPLARCIEMTGGVQSFPNAKRLDLLAHRLVELGLADEWLTQYDADSGLMQKVTALVKSGNAAPPVQKTFDLWKEVSMRTL